MQRRSLLISPDPGARFLLLSRGCGKTSMRRGGVCVCIGGVVSSLLGHRCQCAVPILSSIGNGSTPRHRSLLSSPPPSLCSGLRWGRPRLIQTHETIKLSGKELRSLLEFRCEQSSTNGFHSEEHQQGYSILFPVNIQLHHC